MSLQVGDRLLQFERVVHNLLLALFSLDANFENLINDLLKILHQIIVLALCILIGLVDDVNEDFTVILKGPSERLQVVINLRERVIIRERLLTSSENWSTLSSKAVKLVKIV